MAVYDTANDHYKTPKNQMKTLCKYRHFYENMPVKIAAISKNKNTQEDMSLTFILSELRNTISDAKHNTDNTNTTMI